MSVESAEPVVITRILNAPVPRVWDAWTKPEHVRNWWGPKDYTCPACEIELRAGGRYLFAMRSPDSMGGEVSYTTGTYTEIALHRKLAFTQSQANALGERLPDEQLPPDFPSEVFTTITFTEVNGMTELVITESGWRPSLMSVFAYAGMHQSLDKLSALVRG